MAGIKTTSYAENVVALAHARARGCTEAIFANTTGGLCEGTGTNVFVVVDGRLVTPPLSSGCLAGVTRDLVLELTEAIEADLPMDASWRPARCSSPPPAATCSPSPPRRPTARASASTPRQAAAALAALQAATDDP